MTPSPKDAEKINAQSLEKAKTNWIVDKAKEKQRDDQAKMQENRTTIRCLLCGK